MKNINNNKIAFGESELICRDTNDGSIHRIVIKHDDDAMDPRDYDNVSRMVCDVDRYTLGDAEGVEEELRKLVKKYYTDEELVRLVEEGKINLFQLIENPDEQGREEYPDLLQVWGNRYNPMTRRNEVDWIDVTLGDRHEMGEDIREELTIGAMINLVREYAVIETLSVYEHSGITIYLGNRLNDWDSYVAGIVYIEKEKAMNEICQCDESNWREKALACIEDEVEIYRNYIEGNCYGYTDYIVNTVEPTVTEHIVRSKLTGEIIDTYTTESAETEEEEEVDSLSNFYGDDHTENGLIDELPTSYELIEVR